MVGQLMFLSILLVRLALLQKSMTRMLWKAQKKTLKGFSGITVETTPRKKRESLKRISSASRMLWQ